MGSASWMVMVTAPPLPDACGFSAGREPSDSVEWAKLWRAATGEMGDDAERARAAPVARRGASEVTLAACDGMPDMPPPMTRGAWPTAGMVGAGAERRLGLRAASCCDDDDTAWASSFLATADGVRCFLGESPGSRGTGAAVRRRSDSDDDEREGSGSEHGAAVAEAAAGRSMAAYSGGGGGGARDDDEIILPWAPGGCRIPALPGAS